ncbi:hypothetical protein AGLY_016829 [Aphis glycines]|uniref:Reverse transcriptase domain-containing protein n=1 Tax=Aphis glycines TaxID=307491 RepID=A0A6G0SXA8_APHGL|nr:hypothetical protein AGLY_016829 [Aphis glycines]
MKPLAPCEIPVYNTLLVSTAYYIVNLDSKVIVVELADDVENGLQEKLKSGAIFFELSEAYDTVCKRDLLLILAKILKCKTKLCLLENFQVYLNVEVSRRKIVQNGLPQGSVLSPTLFNVYTADITETKSRKFMYVVDISLVAQSNSFEQLEDKTHTAIFNIYSTLQLRFAFLGDGDQPDSILLCFIFETFDFFEDEPVLVKMAQHDLTTKSTLSYVFFKERRKFEVNKQLYSKSKQLISAQGNRNDVIK